MSFETSVLLLTWVAILLLAFVVSGLLRRMHFLSSGGVPRESPGPAPGTTAPDFRRFAPGSPKTTVLLFLDRDCASCQEVTAETRALLGEPGMRLAFVALFSGPAHQDPDSAIKVFADEAATFDRYQIPVVPFAVLVDPAGRVQASEPVGSAEALRTLLDETGTATRVTHQNGGPS